MKPFLCRHFMSVELPAPQSTVSSSTDAVSTPHFLKASTSWTSVVTVEPLYNKALGTMKITLLYQVSHYIRVKKKKYKELGPAKLPRYKRILLYPTSL